MLDYKLIRYSSIVRLQTIKKYVNVLTRPVMNINDEPFAVHEF